MSTYVLKIKIEALNTLYYYFALGCFLLIPFTIFYFL